MPVFDLDTGGSLPEPPSRRAAEPLWPKGRAQPYARVVRRASFWNWAGTHHFRKYSRQPRQ